MPYGFEGDAIWLRFNEETVVREFRRVAWSSQRVTMFWAYQEGVQWVQHMRSKNGTEDAYLLFSLNCREYSRLVFRDAPNALGG